MSQVKKRKGKGTGTSQEEDKTRSTSQVPPLSSNEGKSDDKPGETEPPPKFGPMPKLSQHRLWSRSALILGLMAVVWYNSNKKKESPFATIDEELRYRGMNTKCSPSFDKHVSKWGACAPKHCGRLVSDELLFSGETYALKEMVERGLQGAGGYPVAILDFAKGLKKDGQLSRVKFNEGDTLIFQSIKSKLMRMVSSYFGVEYFSLHLAYPVYASRLSSDKGASKGVSKSDEYWHPTVHQDIHDSFHYSTVVFLSDYKKDFEGGRFIFPDGDATNRTVDPKSGRALAFTSGQESRHFTEKVERGTRIALLMGFTCDPSKGKKDPF